MNPVRAHPLLLLGLEVAVAAAILLTGPLLLFAPPLVSFMQSRHDVAQLLDAEPAQVERATTAMLGDLLWDGDFTVSLDGQGPVLDESERSHMRDVGGVVRSLVIADLLALGLAFGTGWALRGKRHARGRGMLIAAAAIGAAAIGLGAFFALAFDAAFAAFHAVFFDPGTWQFGPDSNLLRFFPEPFWFEIALVAGAVIALSAVLVALLGRRDLGAARAAG
jgi:hypothetical protein